MLLNNSVDVSVIVCSRELYGQFLKKFKQKSLVPVILGYTALYITLSEKHPLTKKESTNLVDFTDYPCPVSYTHLDVYKRQEYKITIHAEHDIISVDADGQNILSIRDTEHPYLKGAIGIGVLEGSHLACKHISVS